MKITVAQLNPIVGDVAGNTEKLCAIVRKHQRASDLIVFPELYLTGYPPRDLLKNPVLISRVETAVRTVKRLSARCAHCGILVGLPVRNQRTYGRSLFNAAVLFYKGRVAGVQYKTLLPTYDVFDETRYFESAQERTVIEFKGERLGVLICEDMWNTEAADLPHRYEHEPVRDFVAQGATVLIDISASPFYVGKEKLRRAVIASHVRRSRLPFIFVNQVGANDELIFDGKSLAVHGTGAVLRAGKAFEEDVFTVDMKRRPATRVRLRAEQDAVSSIYDALVLGVREYVRKCGFTQVIVGLSGGIDSAVTCSIAVAALGAEHVRGVTMPSQFSSKGSVDDSLDLARRLGIRCDVVPIKAIVDVFTQALKPVFHDLPFGLAEENLQARIRGTLLMAFSNKFGSLLLTTGNKSEMAVGYCTLYGDMNGGLAVISDVPKTMVYKLARHINERKEVIPQSTIRKAPSAELRPQQTDQDTLPPYPMLDAILAQYVEANVPPRRIVARGASRKTVTWVVDAINRSEYKRRQAAPGLKVTSKAFGVGRRYPIATRFTSK